MMKRIFLSMLFCTLTIFGVTTAFSGDSSYTAAYVHIPFFDNVEERERPNIYIQPQDVYADTTLINDTTYVVWAGIITNLESGKQDTSLYINFMLQHHYTNWGETGGQLILSKQGDGRVGVTLFFDDPEHTPNVEDLRKSFVGNVMVLYGTPGGVHDSTVWITNAKFITRDFKGILIDSPGFGKPIQPVNADSALVK